MRYLTATLLTGLVVLPCALAGQDARNGPWHLAAQRSGGWFHGVDSVLRAAGASVTWRAVPLLRSGGDPGRRTPDGRAGLWALTPDEGHALGLRITQWLDARLDPIQSTAAVIQQGVSIVGHDTMRVLARPTPVWPDVATATPIRIRTTRFLSLMDVAKARRIPLQTLQGLNRHLVRGYTVPGEASFLYLPRGQSQNLGDIPDVRLVGVVALHHGTLRDLAIATQVPLQALSTWNPGRLRYERGDVLRVPSVLRHATARARPLPLAAVR